MTRSVTLLGTVHEIQGAEKASWRNLEDPAYLRLVKWFLEGKDFIFEEASELGPTKAERLATELFGTGHYLDVDPHSDHRFAYGIGITGQSYPIDPCTQLTEFYRQECDVQQSKRENLWLDRVKEMNFGKALFICGYLHALSMASKLRLAEFNVETWTYVPYLMLCPRSHGSG